MTVGLRLRLVDGSILKEPGKTGSQWRLPYSVTVPELCCDYVTISPSKGAGTDECFTHYPVQAGDYLMGDRGDANAKGIAYIAAHQGYVLVRVNTGSLPLSDAHGEPFDLLAAVRGIEQPWDVREWSVSVKERSGSAITGRLCALRKSAQAIEQAQQKLIATARKKQTQVKPETLEYAQ
jgi:hypothetical protein